MKIRVLAILRGDNLIANVGDIIEVDEKIGDALVNAGAAELIEDKIIEIIEVTAWGDDVRKYQYKDLPKKVEETETIELIKEEKKELDIKENPKKRGR